MRVLKQGLAPHTKELCDFKASYERQTPVLLDCKNFPEFNHDHETSTVCIRQVSRNFLNISFVQRESVKFKLAPS